MSGQPDYAREIAKHMGLTPYIAGVGGEVVEVGNGRGRMRLPYSDKLIGDPDTGVVHGGVITAFLDHCCGMAVATGLRDPMPIATLDLRIDYMKPATPGADIFFEAEVLKVTHEIAFARAVAYHVKDDPIAISNGTFMLTRGPVPYPTRSAS
ncbi:MAG: PaaI family thioesterase [Proteobacteria bacterium]|nr:PaaI family thioesterase [Pseudomonadota bacterium]